MDGRTRVEVKRHVLKTITWRIIATLTTILLAWLFTNDVSIALKFGGVEIILKMVLYFLHERTWYKYFKFGVKYINKNSNETKNGKL